MAQYKGASRQHEVRPARRRKDTRLFGARFREFMQAADGIVITCMLLPIFAVASITIPMSGELMLFITWLFWRSYASPTRRAYDFPYRIPKLAGVRDGSTPKGQKVGDGITYLGQDLETREQIYAGNSDLRTHMLVLGTTGSGKPQPLHAKVLTPGGWRAIGDLVPGDLVTTPTGQAVPVLRVFEQGVQPVWRLRTRCGRKAEATGDHLWRVLVVRDGQESAETLPTDAIRGLLEQRATVLIPRAIKTWRKRFKVPTWTRLWKVEPAGSHPCRCIEIDDPQHLYVTNDLLVTHNTEFLLGLVFNALVQNTGFIYVDGKGDPKLQKEVFRLARYLGREDDLLIINFITSGRDFVEKQFDKVTNNMNIMGNTSSGMLIELIVSLMDDAGGGGDMWKGRAISFVAALTRPLIYLRDKGYINLSPEKYLEYFELPVIEELVWEHNGKYGPTFDVIVAPLRSYLVTLPGYQKQKIKKQEQKTLEQHGFIVMQLTRIFNDLNFNYGHIFKTRVGDVDFYDVVTNRRLLVVLLPALERAPDSLRMLGKMIVGSIKQMMAGCLGNRVEGLVREIIDARPTNAPFPFYTILDEYGYYAVIGFAVAPAQARSLGFSVIFAAQDFSSLKKSSAEEADATWENTNVRAIGRITSGQRSETWERIQGASGESLEASTAGFDRRMGTFNEVFRQADNVTVERRARLDYDDLAMQENGEFTFLIGKKENSGRSGGVRVIRGMGFYTAGKAPKEMRINDLLPVESPEPSEMPQNRKALAGLLQALTQGTFAKQARSAIKGDPVLAGLHALFERNVANPERARHNRTDAVLAALGWFLAGMPPLGVPAGQGGASSTTTSGGPSPAPAGALEALPSVAEAGPDAQTLDLHRAAVAKAMASVSDLVLSTPKPMSGYTDADPVGVAEDSDEISISSETVSTNLLLTDDDSDAFRDQALPILRQHLLMLDDMPPEEEWDTVMPVAERERLVEVEVVAEGHGFGSMDEKLDAEERADATRLAIAQATRYIDPPTPAPLGAEGARQRLEELKAQCSELMRGGF